MKLLYVSAEYYPTEIAISIRSRFNVAAFLEQGHDVVVLTTGDDRVGPIGEKVAGIGKLAPDNTSGLKKRLIGELSMGWTFGSYVLRNRGSFDKLVITSPPFFSLLLISLFLKFVRKPFVVDVRDRYPQTLFSLGVLKETSLAGRILSYAENRIYNRAETVITVTQPLKDAISRETGKPAHLVRNGFDERLFDAPTAPKSPRKQTRIVQHGLFGRLVDADNFIKIANYCAVHAESHEFLLVGYGEKLDYIADQGLPNVRVLPKQSQSEIAAILHNSDIGLACMVENENTRVAMPVKVFEYVGASLPVVHLPIGVAGAEVQQHGLGFSSTCQEWEKAAEFLVKLIGSPEIRRELSQNVRKARHNYSRQGQSKLFAELVTREKA